MRAPIECFLCGWSTGITRIPKSFDYGWTSNRPTNFNWLFIGVYISAHQQAIDPEVNELPGVRFNHRVVLVRVNAPTAGEMSIRVESGTLSLVLTPHLARHIARELLSVADQLTGEVH